MSHELLVNWQIDVQAYGELQYDVALSQHTTLAVGGNARFYFKPKSIEALQQSLPIIPQDMELFVLGRGSNLLISDNGFDGLILDLGCLQSLAMNQATLRTEAGCRMSKIAQKAASMGYAGLEFMATVPGDLGGGVAMNAGAFGQQVSDTLQHIDIIDRDGNLSILPREQLAMHYRHTVLSHDSIVVSASFLLQEDDANDIRMRMRDMRQQRSQSQPLALPNCGSVFKNPDNDYAARLIEAVGLKGEQRGQAQISEVHANFIVNHGGATANDVLALIRCAQSRVQQQFQIYLEPEVRMLGSMDKENIS
ncbi:MAG: UDP-N-acetylmuramate dehydrogenase [Mariprofundaceae bacterium]|nr:UDP-N-acetylmuramate dehydrogenase [Mariprofundaceae bacterium]